MWNFVKSTGQNKTFLMPCIFFIENKEEFCTFFNKNLKGNISGGITAELQIPDLGQAHKEFGEILYVFFI